MLREDAPPRTTVMVLNFNGRRHLEACLESLGRLDVFAARQPGQPRDRSLRDEVWLVDNASSDDSVAFVRERFPWVRVIESDSNLGFSRAYNRAAAITDSRYLAFLNNDTRVPPDWLTELHRCRERHPAAAVVASCITSWDGKRIDFVGADTFFTGHALQRGVGEPLRGQRVSEAQLLFGCAGSLLVQRNTFLDIGGFDPDYFSFFEDVDFGWRASALGHETWLAPKATTFHRLHATWGDAITPRKRFLLERNALSTMLKNYEEERAGVMLLVCAALAFLRGWWAGRHVPAPGVLETTDALCHMLAIADVGGRFEDLAKRRVSIQSNRKRSDEELWPLFGALAAMPLPPEQAYRDEFAHARARVLTEGGNGIGRWDKATNEAARTAFASLARLCEFATRHHLSPTDLDGIPTLDVPHALPFAVTSAMATARRALSSFLNGPFSPAACERLATELDTARPRLIEGGLPATAPHRAEESAPPSRVRQGAPPPTISVVIRTQNRQDSLARALGSVASQSLQASEVVVVNDGGPDPSIVLARFGGLPCRLIQHERAFGRSRAAQAGLEAARCEYINFLDDDDVLAPAHLAVLADGIATSGLPVAYTDVECIVVDGTDEAAPVVARSVFGADFDPDRLAFENTIPIMAVLMRRELALAVGGFDASLEYYEDWDLWLRLARVTAFHHCPVITATYNVRPALGQGLAIAGDQRWQQIARLFDKHRDAITGDSWAAYYRHYVEPSRGRVSAAEESLHSLGQTLRGVEAALFASQQRANQLSAQLRDIQGSRLWRWLGWLWRLRRAAWVRRLRGQADSS